MTPPATASLKEFARILGGVKPGYVSQLKRDGRLVMAEDGKRVQVAESLQLIKDTRDPSKVGAVRRHAAARAAETSAPAAPPPETDDPADDALDGLGRTFHEARARREHYQALEAKRAYEVAIGKVVDAREVANVVSGAVVTLRTRLESLPDLLAPQMVGLPDEGRARALLAEAIEHALDEASRQFSALSKAPA